MITLVEILFVIAIFAFLYGTYAFIDLLFNAFDFLVGFIISLFKGK